MSWRESECERQEREGQRAKQSNGDKVGPIDQQTAAAVKDIGNVCFGGSPVPPCALAPPLPHHLPSLLVSL